MPLLQILTRHHPNRPNMLRRNQESLARQTSDDWEQTLIVDDVGRGVPWANAQLAEVADDLTGDYIWVLDDDDECIDSTLVEDIARVADVIDPDVIVHRCDHRERHGIIPDDEHWNQRPEFGHIGMSNFIVRREVFVPYARHFSVPRGADFNFISSVWAMGVYHWLWRYSVIMRTQSPEGALFGAPEPADVA